MSNNTIVKSMIEYVENSLHNDLSLDHLSKVAGYSKYHFLRLFQAEVGVTASEYIRYRRIANAAKKLIYSNDSILEIALFYRFETQESFTRSFKRTYNLPPGQYRRIMSSIHHQQEVIALKNEQMLKGWCNETEPFQLLESNSIAYLYMGGFFSSYLKDYQSEIDKSKGLFIDLRSYPADFGVFEIGEYLLPDSREFAKFTYGSLQHPGMFKMTDPVQVGEDNGQQYNGKIVILINEVTQSMAEYYAMAFRTAENAIVIGSTTAAADGDISFLTLPGGIETSITGIGVYYPDGTETQRVGIIPDIYVTPTIKGIKEGRDELIEKAIEITNQP